MTGNKRKRNQGPLDSQQIGTVSVVLDQTAEAPFCPHGPTILFRRESKDGTDSKCFYACAAHRDRKGCSFFMWQNLKVSQAKKQEWKKEVTKNLPVLPTFEDISTKDNTEEEFFIYCHTCSKLMNVEDLKGNHTEHKMSPKLSKSDLASPTKILTVQNLSKKEAQFYFSQSTLDTIVKNLLANNLTRVLCVGTPKIHEKIRQSYSDKMKSILLDFDNRLSQFFSKSEFCYYNMFNHHFFGNKSNKNTYLDFLRDSKPGKLVIVTDPPFGGRCELVANTYKAIQNEFAEIHIKTPEKCRVEMVWIFPYFMEFQVKASLPEIGMSDYHVSYEPGSGYRDGKEGGTRKQGSPVRIFTTINLSKIDLSFEDGYKFCKQCNVWVSALNKHCEPCGSCTGKNGGAYSHCDICKRCVKESWKHCSECNRCALPDHRCNQGKVSRENMGPKPSNPVVSKKPASFPKKTGKFAKKRVDFAKKQKKMKTH